MGISLKGFGKESASGSGASISGISALPPAAAEVRLPAPLPNEPATGVQFGKWLSYYDWGGTDAIFHNIEVDSSGNIYTLGTFRDAWAPKDSNVLAKWASDGSNLWVGYVARNSYAEGVGLAIDSNDNVYTCHKYHNSDPTFGGFGGAVMTKWNTTTGAKTAITNIFSTSVAAGSLTVDSNDLLTVTSLRENGPRYAYVMTFNTSLQSIEQRYVTFTGITSGDRAMLNEMAIDSTGKKYVVGYQTIAGTTLPYIMSYTNLSSPLWNKKVFLTGGKLEDITIDNADNIFTIGSTGSTAFVSNWNTSGILQWTRNINNLVNVSSCETDSSGNVYVVGDNIVLKLDPSGATLWSKELTVTSAKITDLYIDNTDNIIIVGKYHNGTRIVALLGTIYNNGSSSLSFVNSNVVTANQSSLGSAAIAGHSIGAYSLVQGSTYAVSYEGPATVSASNIGDV